MKLIFNLGFSYLVHFAMRCAIDEALYDSLPDEVDDQLERQSEKYEEQPEYALLIGILNDEEARKDKSQEEALKRISSMMRLKKL